MNILISGVGGATPRSIARRIRQLYPDSCIIGTDLHPKALGFHMMGLIDKGYIVPRSSSKDYWAVTKNIIEENEIDFAFIQPEKEVIAWGNYYERHQTFPCPVLIPPVKLAEALINKANMSEILEDTHFIPKTLRISPTKPCHQEIKEKIGYPCWIRATEGSGGFGSLKLNNQQDLEAWLLIHKEIQEFTVSEYLPGRHLANQMLYIDGKCIKNAGLECVEYVMANVAPSKVTGNTSFGRFLNEEKLLQFCEKCADEISGRLGVKPHGVLSFDLKEDANGGMKVTEINIRHMAYTGIMASAGFDLVNDTIMHLTGRQHQINNRGHYFFEKNYIFLRDVDIEPVLMEEHQLMADNKRLFELNLMM